MKVLVLGGDGFIGSYLVEQAVTMGHEVAVFDRFYTNVSKNLEHLRRKIRFISGEFANRDQVAQALTGQEIVYHFICATNPALSWNDPLIDIEENLKYSVQCFELAVERGVRKIVFSSSGGAVYGRQSGVITENTLPDPSNPYGIAKLATEGFLTYFSERFGVAADVYRTGNAYGPREPVNMRQGVIAVWMSKILRGETIEVFGDRDVLRDYVFAGDVAYLMTHSLVDLALSGRYNLGTGRGVSILGLLDVFKKVIDVPFQYSVSPRRVSDTASVVLDSSKLCSFFPGFTFRTLEEQVRDTWLYVKEEYARKTVMT